MDTLSDKNQAKLTQAIPSIENIVKVGNQALEKFPTDEYNLEVFVYLNYLERFVFNLDSINILLKVYEAKPYVETAIGLTLRANLLDFMAITYLSSYEAEIKSKDDKENEDKYNKQFDAFIADHIHNTFKYLKLTKDHKLITDREYKTTIENISYTYKFLFKDKTIDFENPDKGLISKERKSPTDYFKRINSHPLTKKFAMVYDLYTYYSKYEHFGIMTHFIQRQGLDNDFETMIASIKYVIRGIGASLAYLSYPVDKLQQERDEIEKLQDSFDNL